MGDCEYSELNWTGNPAIDSALGDNSYGTNSDDSNDKGGNHSKDEQDDAVLIIGCGYNVADWACENLLYNGELAVKWLYDFNFSSIKAFGSCQASTIEGCTYNDKMAQALAMQAYFNSVIEDNPNARVYLFGHSGGADAVIFAIYEIYNNGVGDSSNIGKVAIVDPYSEYKGADQSYKSNTVANWLGDKIYGWGSNSFGINFGNILHSNSEYPLDKEVGPHALILLDNNVRMEISGFFGVSP